jgi:hypothetical protein
MIEGFLKLEFWGSSFPSAQVPHRLGRCIPEEEDLLYGAHPDPLQDDTLDECEDFLRN